MTATIDDIVQYARNRLRDTGELFQAEVNGNGVATIFTLNVVCVEAQGLSIVLQPSVGNPTVLQPTDYTLYAMKGQFELTTTGAPPGPNDTLYIQGVHYIWFTNDAIAELAPDVIGRLEFRSDYVFANTTPGTPQFEVAAAGTIVEMLWSVWTEQSFDIDLRDPEGVDFPIAQRVRQLEDLLNVWKDRFQHLSEILNIGIDRIEMGNLRRVSRTTGRLVPLYTEQEIDDTTPPVRLYPYIDKGA